MAPRHPHGAGVRRREPPRRDGALHPRGRRRARLRAHPRHHDRDRRDRRQPLHAPDPAAAVRPGVLRRGAPVLRARSAGARRGVSRARLLPRARRRDRTGAPQSRRGGPPADDRGAQGAADRRDAHRHHRHDRGGSRLMASFTRFGNDLYTGARSIDFIGRRRVWYVIAAIVILASVIIPFMRGGYHFGIEFTGGSEYTVSNPPADKLNDTTIGSDAVKAVVPNLEASVSVVGRGSVRVQTAQLTSRQSEEVRTELASAYSVPVDDVAFSFIGPSWGADITSTAVRGLVVFLVLVTVVMALYFRTWKMSVAALVALAHDLILTAGIYGIVGFEVTPAAVIGFLT